MSRLNDRFLNTFKLNSLSEERSVAGGLLMELLLRFVFYLHTTNKKGRRNLEMSSSFTIILCIFVLFSAFSLSCAYDYKENEEALREAARHGEFNCIPSNYNLLRSIKLLTVNCALNHRFHFI